MTKRFFQFAVLLMVVTSSLHAITEPKCDKAFLGFLNTTLKPRVLINADNTLGVQILDPSKKGSKILETLALQLRGPLGIEAISQFHKRLAEINNDPSLNPFERLVKAGKIVTDLPPELLAKLESIIPKTGPLVFTSNHPLSGIEGLVLAAVLLHYRPDLKIMMAPYFEQLNSPYMEELKKYTIVTDNSGEKTDGAKSTHMQTFRATVGHVADGGALLAFPSGRISIGKEDPAWESGIGHIIRKANASVVPIFVPGEPPALSNFIRKVAPAAGMVALLREVANQIGSTVTFDIGPLVPNADLSGMKPADIALFLRKKTYDLRKP